MFPPEVIGTADFIAPEVLSTKHLDIKDPKRALPNQKTDLHALAVLIYMYLLRRHPLKGSKVWDLDAEKDELLAMGEKALFIEHPTDATNRVKPDQLRKWDAFWGDPASPNFLTALSSTDCTTQCCALSPMNGKQHCSKL